MAEKKITELTQLETEEVSLVTAGANQKSRFPLTKEKSLKALHKACIDRRAADGEDEIMSVVSKLMSEKGSEAVRSALRVLDAFKEEMPVELFSGITALLSGDAQTEEVEAEKPSEEETPMVEKKAPELEALQKSLEDANKRAEATEKALAAEIGSRLTREFVEKARASMPAVGNPEELGALLKDLHAVSAELCKRVEGALQAASDRITPLIGLERGTSRPGPSGTGESLDGVEAQAREMAKAQGISYEQAYTKALDANPKAYAEYIASRRAN